MIAQFHICHSGFVHESILKIKTSPSSSLSFPKLLQQYLGLFGNFVLMPRLPYQQTPRSGIQTGHRQGCVGRTGIVLMLGLHGPCRGVPGARRGRGQQMLLAPSSSLHGPAKHVNGKIKILIAEEEAFQDRCSGTCPLLSLFVTLLLRSLPLLWHRSLLGDYLTSSLLHQTHAGLFSLLLALIQHPSPA